MDGTRATKRRAILVDCGNGRRLERFGDRLVDRPAPSAERSAPASSSGWAAEDVRYDRRRGAPGVWSGRALELGPCRAPVGGLTFELRLAEAGQVGVFPEQVPMWAWLRSRIRAAGRPITLLNLFAYTGGASLAAASAGASVVHVDASRTSVAWARRNAELSGLGAAPIRWLTEDAETFVAREMRRGHRYDAVVLDPPSHGHGPGGKDWHLEDRLPALLMACAALSAGQRAFLLVTTHTPGYGPDRLGRELEGSMRPDDLRLGRVQTGPLELRAESGQHLPLGAFARWVAR
jgi:23S rRNA (cytosine1962-C5)-methyltransferase